MNPRIRSNWRCLTVAFVSIVTTTASADTLAWYHFEEKDAGERATCAADAIIDMSAHGKHGTVVSLNHMTEGTDASLAPTYIIPRCAHTILDPVSGESRSNPAAFNFDAIGTAASQTGAVVKVSDFFPNGTPFGSVTVEALVCTSGGSYDSFAPIIGLWSSADSCTTEYWSLMMNSEGQIATRFDWNISDGSQYSRGRHRINDGQWHHIALVHDGTTDYKDGKISVHIYVDGELDADYSWTASKSKTYKNTPLYIGGYTKRAGRIFNGFIDEVRISDQALAPEQFLSIPRRTSYPIDADTYVYLPLENAYPMVPESANLNVVSDGPTFYLKKSSVGTDTADIPDPIFESDSPSQMMSDGLFSANAWLDETCCHLRISPKTNGSGIRGESEPYVVNTSFTAEIFFKYNASTKNANEAPDLLRSGPTSSPCFRVRIGKCLYFAYNNWDADAQTYAKAGDFAIGREHQYDDGKWHHVAIVYDRPAQMMRLYVDYRLCHVGENVNLESENYPCYINGNTGGDNWGYFDGWVDEFRFTKRTLELEELLHPLNPGDEGRDTLLRASFENDWSVSSGMGRFAPAETIEDGSAGETVGFYDEEHDGRLAGDYIWTNRVKNADCHTNLYAAKLERGYIGFPELPYYEGKDITAEAFVRIGQMDESSCIFRYLYGDDPAYSATPIFALYSYSATDGRKLNCRIGFISQEFGPAHLETAVGTKWLTFTLGQDLFDGRWHHVAIVAKTDAVNPTEENGNVTERTTIRIFVDYQEARCTSAVGDDNGYIALGYHLAFRSAYSPRPRFSIGTGSTNRERWTGAIDELRLSGRALEPAEFLQATRRPRGMLMIMR